MIDESNKWAVILIGPPGSGKDTQVELLVKELKFVEIRTSKIIEDKLKAADPNDPVMNREKDLKKSGQLNTSSLVEEWVIEKIEEVGKSDSRLIANGWPRKVIEAEIEMSAVNKYYPKDFVKVICIELSEEESVKRNSKRRVCEKNGHPIPNFPEYKDVTMCPEDGSLVITRQDDNLDIARHRYGVYKEFTEPVIDFLSKQGYNLVTINGEQPIEDVHCDILNKLW